MPKSRESQISRHTTNKMGQMEGGKPCRTLAVTTKQISILSPTPRKVLAILMQLLVGQENARRETNVLQEAPHVILINAGKRSSKVKENKSPRVGVPNASAQGEQCQCR